MVDVSPHVLAAERLHQLPDNFASDTGFAKCVESLRRGESATFDSVWGSACALLVATLSKSFDNILVVVGDAKSQDNLLDDLGTFHSGLVDRFPAYMLGASSAITIDLEYGERLRLIKSLAQGDTSPIIVATVPALLQPLPSRESITGNSKRISNGERLDVESFVKWLLEQGFHQTTAVELPGEFSNRGGILDVYAADWEGPVRIELFDDEIESLRQFDTATQRSNAELQQIEITVLNQEEADGGYLSDFLPENTLLLVVEPENLQEQAK